MVGGTFHLETMENEQLKKRLKDVFWEKQKKILKNWEANAEMEMIKLKELKALSEKYGVKTMMNERNISKVNF